MNCGTWIATATRRLTGASVGTARLDALVLLEDVTGKDRSWLLAHPEHNLDEKTFHSLNELIARREKHEPLAYVRGKTEFYGREFAVNQNVLEPRPESETIIELLKQIVLDSENTQIVDVGTGSGALAITAKLEFPTANVLAIDIDPACLAVAQQNAAKLHTTITFLEGDLLSPVMHITNPDQNLIILANLPYVPDTYHINEAAMLEPRLAIFGGEDGLDLYRRMFAQIQTLRPRSLTILAESLPFQHAALAEIAQANKLTPDIEEDFIQVFKPE